MENKLEPIHHDDIYSKLLHLKDEINFKLLEETEKSADLAQIQSSIEAQLREFFENTLHNVKAEFDKRRKTLIHGMKQLEVASNSVSKAGRYMQKCPGKTRSSVKKCKRRIRVAKHTLFECTSASSEIYVDLQEFVTNQISLLRNRLTEIPDSMYRTLTNLQSKRAERQNLSDSDSDVSIDWSLNSSTEELTEVKHLPNVQKDKTIHQNCFENPEKNSTSIQEDKVITKKISHTTQLNGVDLFTSDSDSLEEIFDTGSYPSIMPTRKTQNKSIVDGELALSRQNHFNGTNAEPKDISMSTSNVARNELSSSVKSHDQQKMSVSKLKDEINEQSKKSNYVKRSTDANADRSITRVSRRDLPKTSPNLRSNQKRFLPSLPSKSSCEQLTVQRDQNPHKLNRGQVLNSAEFEQAEIEESFDLEEMEFKETVKTTRNQILNKLKSKFSISPRYDFLTSTMDLDDTATLFDPSISMCSNSIDTTLTSIKDSGVDLKSSTQLQENNLLQPQNHESNLMESSANETKKLKIISSIFSPEHTLQEIRHDSSMKSKDSSVTAKPQPVYSWKRLEIFKRTDKERTSKYDNNKLLSNLYSDSAVGLAIQKFENAVTNEDDKSKVWHDNSSNTTRRFRSRSATGPRIKQWQHTTTNETSINNKALQPRVQCRNSSYDTGFRSNNDNIKEKHCKNLTSESSFTTAHTTKTESDLDKICSRNSRKTIREAWRHRRSVSMNPKLTERVVKSGAVYDFIESFLLPCHKSQCHASGIVVLSNDFIVVLDERHCCLVLFDKERTYLSQYSIMNVPSGITSIKEKEFAVSYPFRSKIGLFREHEGTIVSEGEIIVPCNEWLTDLSFSQDAFYALCKGGHIHVVELSGNEIKKLMVGVNGKITINQSGKRIYITGAGRVTRFDSDGNELSNKTNVNAFCVIPIGDNLYIGDRNKHKLVPLSDHANVPDLTSDNIEFPSAVCVYRDLLFVTSFEETLNVDETRRIKVYRLRKR